MEEMERKERPREEIFSRVVRAGKRTYFFDVKCTKMDEFYLTITESKKIFDGDDGKFHFEKHKLFIYNEDFEKFSDALNAIMEFVKNGNNILPLAVAETPVDSFADITFEDLKDEPQGINEEKID